MDIPKLPFGLNDRKKRTGDTWFNTRLVSSLRQRTQWKHSPAFGHQARNNSAASLSPKRDDALSREALLAEQVSLNRRLKRQEDGDAKDGSYTKWRCQSEPIGEEPKRHRFYHSRYLRRLRTSDSASSLRRPQRRSSPQSEPLSSQGMIKQKNALEVMCGLRQRNVNDNYQRWSFEPFLRSENHPVFVQPVKDYVMKRCGLFRSKSRKQSSTLTSNRSRGTRSDRHRAAFSASRDSIQLNRHTQVMNITHDRDNSLENFSADTVASLHVPVGRERPSSVETLRSPTGNAQTTTEPEPLTLTECSSQGLSMNTDYFSSTEWVPRHFLQSPESSQTRNRTSTSGTTVYTPPLIVEALPNSKRIGSNGSTSSGTLSGTRD